MAPGYEPQPPPPAYVAAPAYGQRPPLAPMPKRSSSGITTVLVALAVAFVVGLGIVGLVALTQDDDDAASTPERSERVDAVDDEGDEPAAPATAPPTTVAGASSAARTTVDGGDGIRWTMRGDPQAGSMQLNPAPGVDVGVRLWTSSFGLGGDTVGIYDVGGGAFSLESGLRGAVASSGGSVISGPGAVTIAGRSGTMLVATFESNGVVGIARHAMVPLGDRILYLVTFSEGEDTPEAEQAFADLVASVSYG
ncbi:MAG: hypothetical protein R2702_19490 [Acidimicrobiales bacterium]